MARAWRLTLGVLIVLAIGAWDFGLIGHHASSGNTASSSLSASPSPSASSTGPLVPDLPGVLQPKGRPEFTAAFTGSTLNRSVWNTCYPQPQFEFGNGCTNFGNSSKED